MAIWISPLGIKRGSSTSLWILLLLWTPVAMLPVLWECWTNCKGWTRETLRRGKGFKEISPTGFALLRLRWDLQVLGSSIVSMTYCRAVYQGVDYNYPVTTVHINIKCVCQAHNIMNSICNPRIQFNFQWVIIHHYCCVNGRFSVHLPFRAGRHSTGLNSEENKGIACTSDKAPFRQGTVLATKNLILFCVRAR